MRFRLLLVLLLLSAASNAQKFKFRNDGTSDFLIFNAGNKSAASLYNRTLAWVKLNFDNPDEALHSQSPGKTVRIRGRMKNVVEVASGHDKPFTYEATYSIEIDYKKGKYRVKYIHNAFVFNGERPLFKLTDLTSADASPEAKTQKKSYEAKIQRLLDSHHKFVSRAR